MADPTPTPLTDADRTTVLNAVDAVVCHYGSPGDALRAVEYIVTAARADEREQLTDRDRLLAIVAMHRPNSVTEFSGKHTQGVRQYRTRVKCDGETCDFYTESDVSYWQAMNVHDLHLVAALAQPADTEEARDTVVCPGPCGPTTPEPHPRRPGVLRCSNCKEWLPAASTETEER